MKRKEIAIPIDGLLVGVTFFILIFYNFHRYIFQYNSEATSPLYTNTPLIWKVLKYVLLILFTGLFFSTQRYRDKAKPITYVLLSIVLFILIVNLVQAFMYAAFLDELEFVFYFLLLLPFWFCVQDMSDLRINYARLISFAALVLFAFNFIAIANFFISGRLPALAFEGGLVRFGSFWDDPNGFAFLCVFFVYYFFHKKKYLLALLAFINLIPAFSFSAYLLLFVSMFYWVIIGLWERSMRWIRFAGAIIIAVIFIVTYFFSELQNIYEVKKQSIDDHLYRKLIFNFFPFQESQLQFSEMWYESFLFNYFPFSIIILCLISFFFITLFFNPRKKETKFFIFLFLAANFFFSMLYIFPLNFIFIALLIDYLKSPSYRFRNAHSLTTNHTRFI